MHSMSQDDATVSVVQAIVDSQKRYIQWRI